MFNFNFNFNFKRRIIFISLAMIFGIMGSEAVDVYAMTKDVKRVKDKMEKFSEKDQELKGKLKGTTSNGEVFEVIMDMVGKNGVYVPQEGTSYLANMLVMQANGSNSIKKEVYDKVGDRVSNGVWGVGSISESKLGGFNADGYGVLGGYKVELDNGVDISPFVSGEEVYMNQKGVEEQDKGIVKNMGIGIVEEINRDRTFAKVALMYRKGAVKTERKAVKEGKEEIARGKTDIDTWVLGVQGGYNWWLVREGVEKGIKIGPRIGMTLISINKDMYVEEGGENALKVRENKMDRVIGDIGVGIEGKVNRKLEWKAAIEGEIVMVGEEEEVLARGGVNEYYGDKDKRGTKYYGTYGAPVESKNIKEGQIRIGGNIGADYRVSKGVKVEANISVEQGSNYSEVRGNVGVGMKIGTGRGVQAEARVLKRTKERLELRAREEMEEKKDEVRSMIKSKNKEMESKKKELTKKIKGSKSQSM
jgi:hypothetical protein